VFSADALDSTIAISLGNFASQYSHPLPVASQFEFQQWVGSGHSLKALE
jgi:hypothetical protein